MTNNNHNLNWIANFIWDHLLGNLILDELNLPTLRFP